MLLSQIPITLSIILVNIIFYISAKVDFNDLLRVERIVEDDVEGYDVATWYAQNGDVESNPKLMTRRDVTDFLSG